MVKQEASRDDIRWLGKENPIVNKWLSYHYRGDITYEQALIAIILELAEQNKELADRSTVRT